MSRGKYIVSLVRHEDGENTSNENDKLSTSYEIKHFEETANVPVNLNVSSVDHGDDRSSSPTSFEEDVTSGSEYIAPENEKSSTEEDEEILNHKILHESAKFHVTADNDVNNDVNSDSIFLQSRENAKKKLFVLHKM